MGEEDKKERFWTSLPGILTGTATLVTAVAGLIFGLYQYGVLGSKGAPKAGSDVAPTISTSMGQPGHSSPGSSQPTTSQQAPNEPTVVITAENGTVTTVFADSFKHLQTAKELYLQSGQQVSLDKVKMLEVVRHYDDHASVRITLLNGSIVEGALDAGLFPFSFVGQNDIGEFSIRVDNLKRFVFEQR